MVTIFDPLFTFHIVTVVSAILAIDTKLPGPVVMSLQGVFIF